MKWIISKDGKIFCITTVRYPSYIEKSIKKAGYKIKEVNEAGGRK